MLKVKKTKHAPSNKIKDQINQMQNEIKDSISKMHLESKKNQNNKWVCRFAYYNKKRIWRTLQRTSKIKNDKSTIRKTTTN